MSDFEPLPGSGSEVAGSTNKDTSEFEPLPGSGQEVQAISSKDTGVPMSATGQILEPAYFSPQERARADTLELLHYGVKGAKTPRDGIENIVLRYGVEREVVAQNYDRLVEAARYAEKDPDEFDLRAPGLREMLTKNPHLANTVEYDAQTTEISRNLTAIARYGFEHPWETVVPLLNPAAGLAAAAIKVAAGKDSFLDLPPLTLAPRERTRMVVDDALNRELADMGTPVVAARIIGDTWTRSRANANASVLWSKIRDNRDDLDSLDDWHSRLDKDSWRAKEQEAYYEKRKAELWRKHDLMFEEATRIQQNAPQEQYYGGGEAERLLKAAVEGTASSIDAYKSMTFGGIVGGIAGGVIGAALAGPAGMVKGAMYGARALGALATYGSTSRIEGGSHYQESIANGATHEQASATSHVVGALNGAVESLETLLFVINPLTAAEKGAKKEATKRAINFTTAQAVTSALSRGARTFPRNVAGLMLPEAGEEMIQETTSVIGDLNVRSNRFGTALLDTPVRPWAEVQRIFDAGVAGAFGAPSSAVIKSTSAIVGFGAQLSNAKIAADYLKTALKLANTDSLRAAPRAVADMVVNSTRDGLMIEGAFVDPVRFVENAEKNGKLPQAEAERLMGEEGPRRLEEALSAREDEDGKRQTLALSMQEYLESWAPDGTAEQLLQETTVRRGDISVAEAKRRIDVQKEIQDLAERIAKSNIAPQSEAEAKFVEALEPMLESTGKFTSQVISQSSALKRAIVRTWAKRFGVDPDVLFKDMTLLIGKQYNQEGPLNLGDLQKFYEDTLSEGGVRALAGLYYRDQNTQLLNEKGWAEVRPTESRRLHFRFFFDGGKFLNDNIGEHATDSVLRVMANAIQPEIPDAALLGGNIEAYGSSIEQANRIAAQMELAIDPQRRIKVGVAVIRPRETRELSGAALGSIQAKVREGLMAEKKMGHRRGAPPAFLKGAFAFEAGQSGMPIESDEGKRAMAAATREAKSALSKVLLTKAMDVPLSDELVDKFERMEGARAFMDMFIQSSSGLLTKLGIDTVISRMGKATVVSADIRSFREMNVAFGKKATDLIRDAVAMALVRAGALEINAAHTHGDEFAAAHKDHDTVVGMMKVVADALASQMFFVENEDGSITLQDGVDLAYATGRNQQEAGRGLQRAKREESKRKPERISREEFARRVDEKRRNQPNYEPTRIGGPSGASLLGGLPQDQGQAQSRLEVAAEQAGESLPKELRDESSDVSAVAAETAVVESERVKAVRNMLQRTIFGGYRFALDSMLEATLGSSDASPSEQADAQFWKHWSNPEKFPKPGPFGDGGTFDSINQELGLTGENRVSGLAEGFVLLCRKNKIRTWAKIAEILPVLREVNDKSMADLRLPQEVIDQQVRDAEAKEEDVQSDEEVLEQLEITPALRKAMQYMTEKEKDKLNAGTARNILNHLTSIPSSKEMAAVALAGVAKKGWYKGSAEALVMVFGADAPRFALMLAALSPQNPVEQNLINTLNVWDEWVKQGRPTDEASVRSIMAKRLPGKKGEKSTLEAWAQNVVRAVQADDPATAILSGPKVDSFYKNLIGITEEVTNDAWMATYAGKKKAFFKGTEISADQLDPGKGTGYIAMNVRVREAAKILTEMTGEEWTPANVQETIWSWSKALYEMSEVKGETRTPFEILLSGDLTDDVINETPDFRSLFFDAQYEKIIRDAGYGQQLDELRAARDRDAQEAPAAGSRATGQADEATQAAQRSLVQKAARRLTAVKRARDLAKKSKRDGEKDEELLQTDEDGDEVVTKGYFRVKREGMARTLTILFTQHADPSTIIHESAHAYLEMMSVLAKHKDAPDQVRTDFDAAMRWIGSETGDWSQVTKPMKEKWARGFEQYMLDGVSPSLSLVGAFESFRIWMRSAYRTAVSLDVELNSEIRGVFDRMLATDEEISNMRQAMGASGPMFTSPEQAGMTREEYAKYMARYESAKASESARMRANMARTRARIASAEYQRELDSAREEAEAKFDARKDVMAQKLASQYPMDLRKVQNIQPPPPGGYKFRTKKKNGSDPNEVANMAGYESAKEMFDAINAIPDRDTYVEDAAQFAVLEKDPELVVEKDRLVAEAARFVHDADQGTIIAHELWLAIRKIERKRGTPILDEHVMNAAIELAAMKMVDEMTMKRLSLAAIISEERRWAIASEVHAANGEWAKAADSKQKHLIAFYMFRYVSEARELRDSLSDYAKGIAKGVRRERLVKAGRPFVDTVDSILAAVVGGRFERSEMDSFGVDALVADMTAHRDTIGFEREFLLKIILGGRRLKQLTVGEGKELLAALRNIYATAANRNAVRMQGERIEFEDAVQHLEQEAVKNKSYKSLGPTDSAKTKAQKLKGYVSSVDAYMQKQTEMIASLGGFDTDSWWHRLILQPLHDSKAEEHRILTSVIKPILEMFDKIPEEILESSMDDIDGQRMFPGHKPDHLPTKRFELLMMALHRGTFSSIERLTLGRGITIEQVDAALSTLTRAELEWVQAVWDKIESLWPMVEALEARDAGVKLEKLKVSPFQVSTSDGAIVTMRGGYFPAVYDRALSTVGEMQADSVLDQSFFSVSTSQTHTQKRAKKFHAALSFEPSVIITHLVKVAHDLAYRENLRSVARLLLSEDLKATLQERLGQEQYDTLRPWLKDIGRRDVAALDSLSGRVGAGLRKLKGNMVTSVLGYSLTIAAGDLTNVATAIIGTGISRANLQHALVQAAGVGGNLFVQNVARQSGEVAARVNDLRNEYNTKVSRLTDKTGSFMRLYKQHAFVLNEIIDHKTSAVVWTAAHAQAIQDGKSEESAVRFADDIVRTVLPTHNMIDMSAMQRDPGLIGGLVMYFGYMNLLYNRYRRIWDPVLEGDRRVGTIALAAMHHFAWALITSVLADFLMGRGPEDGDGKDALERYMKWFFRKMLLSSVVTVPLVGQAVESFVLGKQASIRAGPVGAVIEQFFRTANKTFSGSTSLDELALEIMRMGMTVNGYPVYPLRPLAHMFKMADGRDQGGGVTGAVSGMVYGERKGRPDNPVTLVGRALGN